MRRKLRRILFLTVCLVIWSMVGSGLAAEKDVTVMLYMCGSDLESEGAAASLDLEEIAAASIGSSVNVIVETGGAKEWSYDFIEPDSNQRWQVTRGEMRLLEDVGLRNMSEGRTLTSFIRFCRQEFPADRYILILWDHGGGTVGGYAYDERFPNTQMMSIAELNQALDDAGVFFDLIGFDCCLMGTVETAFMVEHYADYMIASQRTEPGEGWYYTPWIQALSDNPAIDTEKLGKLIIDSFIRASRNGYYGNELTLSMIDLSYIPVLFSEMYSFFDDAQSTLVEDRAFLAASRRLGESRAISDNEDLADLVYLLSAMEGSGKVLQRLEQCIVYNGTTIRDHNGLCMYFPYRDLSKVDEALSIFHQIGIEENYQDFITTFANLMVGGQLHSGGGTGNPLGGDAYDPAYWTSQAWVDLELLMDWLFFYEENDCDVSELAIDEKGDGFVLSLPDEEWVMITDVQQRVFLDDGEGYIDLGSDSFYTFDEDGDLLIDFDNTWIALDGEIVCYYTVETDYESDNWRTWGVVPIWYNGEDAELVVVWDAENPYGYVAGWRYTERGAGSSSQRGLFPVRNGMTFDFVCEYYTYDEVYEGSYLWGGMTVRGPIDVSYEDVGDDDCMVYYELYDIYQNSYWTEAVIYSLDW